MSDINKVKPITLTDKETGDKYVLEFSRESVRFAEDRKFDLADVARFPMTKVPELFFYAFRMHHRNMARNQTDKILLEDLKGLPDGMLERLGALYSVPYDVLVSEDDGEEKNARMTVEF